MNLLFNLIFALLLMITSRLSANTLVEHDLKETLASPYIYQSVNVITGSYVEAQSDLTLNGVHPFVLRRCFQAQVPGNEGVPSGWQVNLPQLFGVGKSGILSSEDDSIQCEYDEQWRLIVAKIVNPLTQKEEGWIRFKYEQLGEELYCCHAETHDQQNVRYYYSIDPNSRPDPSVLLHRVETDGKPNVSYDYRQHPITQSFLIEKRDEGNGHFIEFEYYEPKENCNELNGPVVRDLCVGRVKLQKGPVGTDETSLITHRFIYGEGWTEVRDALDQKKIYRFGTNQRLSAIEHYARTNETDELIRVERYCWKEAQYPGLADLLTVKTLEDAQGNVWLCRTFEYDSCGNIVKEELYGNLTGKAVEPLVLGADGKPSSQKILPYTTIYKYSEDDRHLLVRKIEGESHVTTYHYVPDTKKINLEHVVIDDTHHIRHGFEYDEHGFLTKKIVDDGNSESIEDLEGVSERQIIVIRPDSSGKPLETWEGYVNLQTGSEVFQKKTIKTYSSTGQLAKEETFDAGGGQLSSLHFSCDFNGKNISVGEEDGDIMQTEYDEYGNPSCMIVTKPDGTEVLTRRVYDFANRLIREEIIDPHGKISVLSHTYNAIGNRIKTDDANGNTTYFAYDALGRLISTQYPPILSVGEKVLTPATAISYNILDHAITTTDANGWTTETDYNVRGKPSEVRHPDGTIERYTYSIDGLFLIEATINGLMTRFERDGLGRAVRIEKIDREGTVVGIETAIYNSFHRLSQSDSYGTTYFKYDGSGRQIGVEQHIGEITRRLEMAYDDSGMPLYKKNWFGQGEGEFLLQTLEYDSKHQPLSLTKKGGDGSLLLQTGWDNATSAFRHLDKKSAYNVLGQQVDTIEEVDDQGNLKCTTLDAIGRIEKVVKKNAFGTLISKVESRYDAMGNKLLEIHARNGEPFIVAWSYGPNNRIESVVEGQGSSKQKTTTFIYNAFGELTEVVKNDGVSIMRNYDALGRVLELSSSDDTIHYWYTYDVRGNIIKTENLATGQQTLREYDAFNQLIVEQMDTGLSVRYEYDGLGRKTRLVLPDDSAISYLYDAVYLREVVRLSALNEELYKHVYTEYDLEGFLKSAQMIHALGSIIYEKDKRGHLHSIKSSFWSMEVPENGYDKKGNLRELVIRDSIGKKELSFDYDERQQIIEENDQLYTYDELQNRSTSTYSYDAYDEMNQLIKGGDCQYSYDANGNIIEKIWGNGHQYFSYDALDRLTLCVEPKKQKISFAYDSSGRRLSKTVEKWDSLKRTWRAINTEKYLYDGECEIGSLDKDNQFKSLRVLGLGYGAEAGASIAIELQEKVYAPLHDHRGSITALVDSSTHQTVETLRYSAFGETERYDQTGELIENSTVGNPWGFFGKRYDSETELIFFGKRYYDSFQGRWTTPDPLQYVDGPNRYAFVGNNPLVKRDLFGEYSVSEAFHDVSSFFRNIGNTANQLLNNVRHQGSTLYHQIQEYRYNLYGKLNIHLASVFSDPPETGVLGNGEINDSVRLTMINGILTLRYEFMSAAASVSAMHGGVNVHYVFRPTQGILIDLAKSLCAKLGFISVQSQQLASMWKQLIECMGGVEGGGTIIHYAHSIGGTDTYAARHLMSPEEQKMIKVYTFGSASMIPDQGFQSVVNYVSRRDAVSLTVDILGFLRAVVGMDRNVIYIGNFFSFPLIDHLFDAESYRGTCQLLGYEFQFNYGTLGLIS